MGKGQYLWDIVDIMGLYLEKSGDEDPATAILLENPTRVDQTQISIGLL